MMVSVRERLPFYSPISVMSNSLTAVLKLVGHRATFPADDQRNTWSVVMLLLFEDSTHEFMGEFVVFELINGHFI